MPMRKLKKYKPTQFMAKGSYYEFGNSRKSIVKDGSIHRNEKRFHPAPPRGTGGSQ